MSARERQKHRDMRRRRFLETHWWCEDDGMFHRRFPAVAPVGPSRVGGWMPTDPAFFAVVRLAPAIHAISPFTWDLPEFVVSP